MYVVEAPNYPKTDVEKAKAIERFFKRVGENAYNLCKVDAASIYINGNKHALKWANGLFAIIPAERVTSAAINTFVDEVNLVTVNTLKKSCEVPVQAAKATKTICKRTANKLGRCSADDILKNQRCVDVANKASKEALKKTAKVAFVITGLIEGAFAGYEIHKLNKLREKKLYK